MQVWFFTKLFTLFIICYNEEIPVMFLFFSLCPDFYSCNLFLIFCYFNRYIENNLSKIQKREKNLQKLFKSEKAKVKRMYMVLQEAYNIVQRHRDEMKKVNELQLELKQESLANEMKANELGKKEAQLMVKILIFLILI